MQSSFFLGTVIVGRGKPKFSDGSPIVLVEGNVLVILVLGSLYSKELSSENIQFKLRQSIRKNYLLETFNSSAVSVL